MRVGIDGHMIGSRETGNETYCVGLAEGLAQMEDDNEYLVYLSSQNALPSVNGHGRMQRRQLRNGSSAWRLTMGFAQASRSDGLDLLHVTYNVPFFTGCPLVVSVHDISYVHFPEFFSNRDRRLLNAYVPYSVRVAKQVLTLSESAANDSFNTDFISNTSHTGLTFDGGPGRDFLGGSHAFGIRLIGGTGADTLVGSLGNDHRHLWATWEIDARPGRAPLELSPTHDADQERLLNARGTRG